METPETSTPGAGAGLTLRRVAIDTWRENVAYLHRDCGSDKPQKRTPTFHSRGGRGHFS